MSYLDHLVSRSVIWAIGLILYSLRLGSDLVFRIRQKGIDPVYAGQVETAWLAIKTCFDFNKSNALISLHVCSTITPVNTVLPSALPLLPRGRSGTPCPTPRSWFDLFGLKSSQSLLTVGQDRPMKYKEQGEFF